MHTVVSFQSTALGNARNLRVYVPASYGTGTQSYPLVLFHDGQNVFAPGGPFGCWYAEQAYDALVAAGRIREAILVGVDNTGGRIDEYTPTVDASMADGGKADLYLSFLSNEVLPYLRARYRTLAGPSNTAVIGSSLGGLVSFYAAWRAPGVFGQAACMSSSFWWDDGKLLAEATTYAGAKKAVRFWFDSGTAEGSDADKDGATYMVDHASAAALSLAAKGWTYGTDVLLDIHDGAAHNEAAWAARVHKPLLFFLGTRGATVTNLVARLSSPEIDAAGTVPGSNLWVKATWNDGLSAEVPYGLLSVTSPQAALFTATGVYSRLQLVGGAVTEATNIHLAANYGGLTAEIDLAAVPALTPAVRLRVSVTCPAAGASIRMVGDISAVGGWNPVNGFRLYPAGGSTLYTNTLVVDRNQALSFKFVAGDAWAYEELTASGNPTANRTCTASASLSDYAGTVAKWKAVQ